MQVYLSILGSTQDERGKSHFYPCNGTEVVSMKIPGLDHL